jgi:hypothetical protein
MTNNLKLFVLIFTGMMIFLAESYQGEKRENNVLRRKNTEGL